LPGNTPKRESPCLWSLTFPPAPKCELPWAQEGHSRDYYPVQFEMDCLWVDRAQFEALLGHYEALMGLGFSKTEITSGQYHSDRLMRAINAYNPHDAAVEPHRGSRLLALAGHVAQLQN